MRARAAAALRWLKCCRERHHFGRSDAAQRAHAAASLALHLHAGDTCPVCQQTVGTVQPRQTPASLTAAKADVDSATATQRQARAAHQDATKATAAVRSRLDAIQSRLAKAAEVMAGVPAEDELAQQLAAIATADEAVASTRKEAAARQVELTAAEKSRASLGAAEQQAWADLSLARDKLVALGAPAVGSAGAAGLAAAWTALADWAASERARREEQLPDVSAAEQTGRRRAEQGVDRGLAGGHVREGAGGENQRREGNQRRGVECQRHPQRGGAAGCEGNELIGQVAQQSPSVIPTAPAQSTTTGPGAGGSESNRSYTLASRLWVRSTWTCFTSVYSSSACGPSSRPRPLCL